VSAIMFVFLNRTIDLKEIYCYKTNTIFFLFKQGNYRRFKCIYYLYIFT